MLIWGTKVTKPVVDSGKFYCPECTDYKPYQLIAPKKWGHLYFIPVLPLKDFERYVECSDCKNAFKEAVLTHDPSSERAKLMTVLAVTACRGLSMISKAGGQQLAPDAIGRKVALVFGIELGLADIVRDVAQIDSETLLSDASGCAQFFNTQGKEAVLSTAVSQGLRNDEQKQLARLLGRSLGMSDAHIQGVLQNAMPRELKVS